MPNQQLLDYINQQVQLGVDRGKILQDLVAIGWDEQQVIEAIGIIENSAGHGGVVFPRGGGMLKIYRTYLIIGTWAASVLLFLLIFGSGFGFEGTIITIAILSLLLLLVWNVVAITMKSIKSKNEIDAGYDRFKQIKLVILVALLIAIPLSFLPLLIPETQDFFEEFYVILNFGIPILIVAWLGLSWFPGMIRSSFKGARKVLVLIGKTILLLITGLISWIIFTYVGYMNGSYSSSTYGTPIYRPKIK